MDSICGGVITPCECRAQIAPQLARRLPSLGSAWHGRCGARSGALYRSSSALLKVIQNVPHGARAKPTRTVAEPPHFFRHLEDEAIDGRYVGVRSVVEMHNVKDVTAKHVTTDVSFDGGVQRVLQGVRGHSRRSHLR